MECFSVALIYYSTNAITRTQMHFLQHVENLLIFQLTGEMRVAIKSFSIFFPLDLTILTGKTAPLKKCWLFLNKLEFEFV